MNNTTINNKLSLSGQYDVVETWFNTFGETAYKLADGTTVYINLTCTSMRIMEGK